MELHAIDLFVHQFIPNAPFVIFAEEQSRGRGRAWWQKAASCEKPQRSLNIFPKSLGANRKQENRIIRKIAYSFATKFVNLLKQLLRSTAREYISNYGLELTAENSVPLTCRYIQGKKLFCAVMRQDSENKKN